MAMFIAVGVVIFGIAVISGAIYVDVSRQKKRKKRYENGEMTDEEREEYENKLKAKENLSNRYKIVKTMIVNSSQDSRKKASSSIARGAIGGAVLGPAGLVGGALSGKNKVTNTVTFLVEYGDGHRETKTVQTDTREFEKLCKYLEM